MNDIRPKVDSTRDQAANLMANRGDHCRKVVEPQISELNRRFAAISQRIKTGKVGRSTPRWKLVLNDLLRRLRNTLKGSRNPHNKVFKRSKKAKICLRKIYRWLSWSHISPPFSISFFLSHFFLPQLC